MGNRAHSRKKKMQKNSHQLNIYKQSLELSALQREIIIGVLLGDAHLETQNHGKTYRLKFAQSNTTAHKNYLFHLYDIFSDWTLTPPKHNLSNNTWYFNTLSHGSFRFYGHQFYQSKKVVPKLIHRWLTPRALAYWYMDDGSLKSTMSKGVILNTHSFELSDIKRLCEILESKFLLKAWPRKQVHKDKVYYQIYISGHSYEKLRELIHPYLSQVPDMLYKFPNERKKTGI